jgi:hypothetical protein
MIRIMGDLAAWPRLFGLDPDERRHGIETDKPSRMQDDHRRELEPSNTHMAGSGRGRRAHRSGGAG